ALVCAGNGTRVSAVVTSFGGVPTVGTFTLGAPTTAPTSTCVSIGLRRESSAGENRHVRTVSTTASVNGGVDRSTSTAPTVPVDDTATDSCTSPPATASGGIRGMDPSMNLAGSM